MKLIAKQKFYPLKWTLDSEKAHINVKTYSIVPYVRRIIRYLTANNDFIENNIIHFLATLMDKYNYDII